MAANLRQAPANLKHFRSMLDFTPAQLKNVIRSAIALKKVGRGGGCFLGNACVLLCSNNVEYGAAWHGSAA